MTVRLKVCGITSSGDALAAISCGAQYLGFNFYPKSPRYLAPETAQQIIEQLPSSIISVGIFVNEPTPADIRAIMETSGIHLAQLHGDETAAYCAEVGAARVIKALRVNQDFSPQRALEFPASAILLDAYHPKLYGGTGKTADWTVAREMSKLTKVFLAGGLSPENVADAILTVRPFAIDVNSGVESAPGIKDHDKLAALKTALDFLSSSLQQS